jgi:hypothetical protein
MWGKVQEKYCGRKEGGQLEYLGINGRIILKLMFKKYHGRACTAFMWLRIRAPGGGFVNTVMNYRFHKIPIIS